MKLSNQKRQYERVYMCYLDEKYADQTALPRFQVTFLTGVYLPVTQVADFRRRFFSLIMEIFLYDLQNGQIPASVPCHASELFKDAAKADGTRVTDNDRIEFLKGLMDIANEMTLHVVRIGYRRNIGLEELCKSLGENYTRFEKNLLWGLVFTSFLRTGAFWGSSACSDSSESLPDYLVYYCMETDRSSLQQKMVHANTATNMWFREFVGDHMTVDFDRIGDVLSYTKGSVPGVLPDCIGYVLHQRWLESQGHGMTEFKSELSRICNEIDVDLVHEDIVDGFWYRRDDVVAGG